MPNGYIHGDHSPCRSIKSVLEALEGQKVVIVLKGCCEEWVKILKVCHEVVIVEMIGHKCNCPVKFIDIDCICEVITDCRAVLQKFLDDDDCH
ncbi:hypothetical protein ABG79_01038 [Caloramator mitchellensis]|uniref:Uncharacterized protein n=1 Tax=Caloramator mitchellensis TaxID=908809 RepID=A0A0R3JUJ8_CALMK|nr:hypothetical protein [Caloramator mitchellensis]KRQ87235.1 hypothetical protein ABG79_01038 [Caloramator mitchellensis]